MTKKTTNKPTVNHTPLFLSSNKESSAPSLDEKLNGAGMVSAGENNKFFDELYNLYTKCATMKAIVDAITSYVANFTTDSDQENIDEVINNAIFDYVLFNGFAVQVSNVAGYQQIHWIDFKNLRRNADKTEFYYSQEWGKFRSKFINIPTYSPNKQQLKSIFYYASQLRDGHVYPQPRYSGALLDMMTSIEVSRFWNAVISNNMEPSMMITFCNGTPSEEIQKDIEEKVTKKFAGAENAGKTIVTFADSQEQAPQVERLAGDNFDEKYQSLIQTIDQHIFTAFRINPILCGINVATGFSKQEFVDAYNLAYISVIQPIQKTIKKEFAKLGVNIDFQKLTFDEEGTDIEKADIITDETDAYKTL